MLGFDKATGGDEAFRQLVFARIIEPTSKADSLRVSAETGVAAASYPTLNRRLPVFAKASFRQALSTACRLMPHSVRPALVLYDVTTLYFETDAGDGFREPGFSKERRLEPADHRRVAHRCHRIPTERWQAFEGNKAETATMLPVINAFKTAHQTHRRHRGR